FAGTPRSTVEGKVRWFSLDEIPFARMWDDDRYWIGFVLGGSTFNADFYYSRDNSKVILSKLLLPSRGFSRRGKLKEKGGQSDLPNSDARSTARMPEEEIIRAQVGQLKSHNATINLVEYDPSWPLLFERESRRIRKTLGPAALKVEHVGSTSVPG